VIVDRPVESTDLVPTLGSLFVFPPIVPRQGLAGGAVAYACSAIRGETVPQLSSAGAARRYRQHHAPSATPSGIPTVAPARNHCLRLEVSRERDEIDRQVRYLGSLTPDQLSSVMSSFAKLNLSPDLQAMDWVGAPMRFSEKIVRLSMGDPPDRRLQQSAEEVHKSLLIPLSRSRLYLRRAWA